LAQEANVATKVEGFVLISCSTCGTPRYVTKRHARRKSKSCRHCNTEYEDYRAFWLEQFSDTEICTLVESMMSLPFGTIDVQYVAEVRSRVTTL